MTNTAILYAFVGNDPDDLDARRHMVDDTDRSRTLCGRRVGYVWSWATPLVTDCKSCDVQARTRDAALRVIA